MLWKGNQRCRADIADPDISFIISLILMGASVVFCFTFVFLFIYCDTKPFLTLASLQSEPKMGHSVVSGINTSNLILKLKKKKTSRSILQPNLCSLLRRSMPFSCLPF